VFPAFIVWSALAAVVIGLAVYRKLIASREDDLIHLSYGEESLISQQVKTAGALDLIDRWGKILTIGVAVFGFLLAVIYLYQVWMAGLKIE
jgi:hypothetical protein